MATRHYLKLEGRFEIAQVSQDRRAVAELMPLKERAAAERAEIRRQIQEHECRAQAEAATA